MSDEQIHTLRVRAEGDRVLLIADGRAVARLPFEAAHWLAKAINEKAHEAKRYERVAAGQADPMDVRAALAGGIVGRPRILQRPPR